MTGPGPDVIETFERPDGSFEPRPAGLAGDVVEVVDRIKKAAEGVAAVRGMLDGARDEVREAIAGVRRRGNPRPARRDRVVDAEDV